MSVGPEIKKHLSKLSRSELEEIRAWIDDFLEEQLELTDEVKAKLDHSRREIAEGHYTTRKPDAWLKVSEENLSKTWDNPDDDVFNELLTK